MTAKFVLYVREHPHGRVVVTPVGFPKLSVDADSFESARSLVAGRLTRELRSMSGNARAALAAPADAELAMVTVRLQRKKGAAGPVVSVAVVVSARKGSRGDVYLVRAPEVPDFRAVVMERSAVGRAAEEGLREALEYSDLQELLALDQTGKVWLETLELPFPVASEPDPAKEGFSLEDAGDELTRLAADGRLGRLDRRDVLLERVLSALASSGSSSVVLVGPPGVGKTAVVHELAARLAEGSVPPALAGRPLWRISANELIAGASYTGMWQDRARLLVSRGRSERAIFAMGDPISIVDAGRWSQSDNNMARVFRTYVDGGELTLLCECTAEVLAAARRKEPSFIDAFHRIDVPEPSEEEATEIARAAARRLERAQDVVVEEDAIAASVELTRRFEPYRGRPGKAIDALAQAVEYAASEEPGAPVGRETVISSFAQRTGLPRFLLSDEVPMQLEQAREFFEARVLAQPEAVSTVIDLIAVAKAQLNDPNKPLGTLLFVGPTGGEDRACQGAGRVPVRRPGSGDALRHERVRRR